MEKWDRETQVIHEGEDVIPEGAHTFPIFLTGTFCFPNLKEAVEKFSKKESGFIYTRIDNPNFRVLEKKIAALEKGEDALVFSSGMSTITTTLLHLTGKDGLVIATQTLYGCTDELFSKFLPQLGIKVKFVDTRYPESVEKAIEIGVRQKAKKIVVFLETPANPTLVLADINEISKIVKEKRDKYQIEINLVVDNSFASPFNQRPLELGADLVLHSVTKYLSGHGDIILGAAVGNKDFIRESEHSLFHRRGIMGTNPSPFDCWLANRGLKTFCLRMEKHNSNGLRLSQFLENHPAVKRVYYPGLESHPQHTLAKKQMSPGFSGMIAFELRGNQENVRKFLENLIQNSFIALAVSLGYTETLIQCPALMTHALIPRKKRLGKGITDNLIRLSVGIENYEDLEEAFKKSLNSLK